jgi:hypothetical protein
MKFIALALVAASSVVLLADGKTATATAPVAVQIVSPITLISNGIMQFGKVVVDDPTNPVVITLTPTDGDNFTAAKTIVNGSDLKSSQAPTVPFFHARYDSTIGWPGLTVTTDPVVNLGKGVNLVPDLTAGLGFLHNCTIYPLSPGQDAKHFPLGGVLTADAGVFGAFNGQVSVTVAYN